METEFLTPHLNAREFRLLSKFILERLGIHMPNHKKILIESRLQKRLRILQIPTFRKYCDFLFSIEGKTELPHFFNSVTTHETKFFREPQHFRFLRDTILPQFYLRQNQDFLRIWSAACSTGEEAYTIAMVIEEFLSLRNTLSSRSYSILATDISRDVVTTGKRGVYSEEAVKRVPIDKVQKYFMKSRDPKKRMNKIVPELRGHVNFGLLNLNERFTLEQKMDVIFCRNVFIYFNGTNKEKTIRNLCENLRKGGYFFIGCSENLQKIDVPLQRVAPSVFQRI